MICGVGGAFFFAIDNRDGLVRFKVLMFNYVMKYVVFDKKSIVRWCCYWFWYMSLTCETWDEDTFFVWLQHFIKYYCVNFFFIEVHLAASHYFFNTCARTYVRPLISISNETSPLARKSFIVYMQDKWPVSAWRTIKWHWLPRYRRLNDSAQLTSKPHYGICHLNFTNEVNEHTF